MKANNTVYSTRCTAYVSFWHKVTMLAN